MTVACCFCLPPLFLHQFLPTHTNCLDFPVAFCFEVIEKVRGLFRQDQHLKCRRRQSAAFQAQLKVFQVQATIFKVPFEVNRKDRSIYVHVFWTEYSMRSA